MMGEEMNDSTSRDGGAPLLAATRWLFGPQAETPDPRLKEFVASEATCLFAPAAGGGLATSLPPPRSPPVDLLFALKLPQDGNGPPQLQLGCLDAQPLCSMLQLVRDVYLPSIMAQPGWPERLKQEFVGNLHCFLATLTDAVHAEQGRTVLYVPAGAPPGGAQDKGQVQLLESLLLQWMRQIRALVNRGSDGDVLRAEGGPLAELAYWRARTANLAGVREQLRGPELRASLAVLEAAKSPSLPAFRGLAVEIEREAERAASNAAFLAALDAPCKALAAATPAAVPALLPSILDVVRLVWSLSPHYNMPELLAALLRRIGSAVIERCRASLSLPAIFGGQDLDGVLARLRQCAATAAAWRELYEGAARRVSAALPDRPWSFAAPTLFAHLDAFVQRCEDLQEVCAAQQQFGRELEAERVLGGPRAPEVGRAVGEVRAGFEGQMARLRALEYDVLDVRTAAWYGDFAAFKAAARDLEAMLANVLATSFEVAATLAGKLDVLCAFVAVARREGLRKSIEHKTGEWHVLFMAELNSAKAAAAEAVKALPASLALPPQAGRVAVARGLLRRIEAVADALASAGPRLPVVPQAAESATLYEAVHSGLQQSVNDANSAWFAGVNRDVKARLDDSLLRQDKGAGGLLAANLAVEVASALEEGAVFERMRLGVPGAVADLLAARQHLQGLRTGLVQQVVRPYNAVLESLSREERRLFRDRLRWLDRRVLPGVNKLSWASPRHQTDFYVKDAARHCREVAATVADLKAANATVSEVCALLRETLLISIEKKRVYSLEEFEARQGAHQATTRARLVEAYAGLRGRLVGVYRCFAGDSEEVQQEWLRYLHRADAAMLEAASVMVRRSLGEMTRALQGERRGAEVPPLFQLSLVLDTGTGRVELSPALQALFNTVHSVSTAAAALVECLPRLPADVLEGCAAAGALPASLRGLPAAPPYVEQAGRSQEAIAKQMQGCISGVVDQVQALLLYFEKKYRVIWENDKDAYLRRYERAGKPPAAFAADVARFRELSDQVLGEDSAVAARFLRLDCSGLKQTLVASCDQWASKFAQLLASLAQRQLEGLGAVLGEPAAALTDPRTRPSALRMLHARLDGERDELEARIAQCQERYEVLEGLQVAIATEEAEALRGLRCRWQTFVADMEALAVRADQPDPPEEEELPEEAAAEAAAEGPAATGAAGAPHSDEAGREGIGAAQLAADGEQGPSPHLQLADGLQREAAAAVGGAGRAAQASDNGE